MAHDERLATRVRHYFSKRDVAFEEKKMMGGLCFMVNGKMCVGVEKQRLLVRIDPDLYETALGRKGCVPMDFTGRPMRGFVFVSASGCKSAGAPPGWTRITVEPTAMRLYSLIVWWFARIGHRHYHAPCRPWHTTKRHPSFADMLATLRRLSITQEVSSLRLSGRGSRKVIKTVLQALHRAA